VRILFCIPHYFNPEGGGRHGSLKRDSKPRLQALEACLGALHQLFGRGQGMIDIHHRRLLAANRSMVHDIDIVLCTTGEDHLLARVQLPPHLFGHRAAACEPLRLGFECQMVLRDAFEHYDYCCYLEDDLVLHDPWFFAKLAWFNAQAEPVNVLLPNRYEVSNRGPIHKVYVDGNLAPRVTVPWQNIEGQPPIVCQSLGTTIHLERTLNPHSGCYFLSREQMRRWVNAPHFLDGDTSFVGPLESAATLGILKTFNVYKPGRDTPSFLEIQHSGTAFLDLVGRQVHLSVKSESEPH
jgi:hypothetical protein